VCGIHTDCWCTQQDDIDKSYTRNQGHREFPFRKRKIRPPKKKSRKFPLPKILYLQSVHTLQHNKHSNQRHLLEAVTRIMVNLQNFACYTSDPLKSPSIIIIAIHPSPSRLTSSHRDRSPSQAAKARYTRAVNTGTAYRAL